MNRRLLPLLIAPLAIAIFTLQNPAPAADAKADKPVDFKKEVQPLFKAACLKCHQQAQAGGGAAPAGRPPRGPSGGFRLDDRAAALKGGKAGNDILPGKAEDSLLVKLLAGPVTVGDHEIAQMPKGQRDQKPKPFTPEQIDLVKRWINQGAKWE